MKREGRQHGMVQTYPIVSSPWNPRKSNRFETPSTAGLFAKVSQKPTNHSKFTGKCGRPRCASCHMHPACKAKDKTKGTQKLKSCDVVTNYRLVTWRVVDAKPGLNFTGFSATGILNHFDHDLIDDNNDDAYDYYEEETEEEGAYGLAPLRPRPNWIVDSEVASRTVAIEDVEDGDDDEKMSFCEVGFAWEQVEGDDEGWCLVEEI
ncbi:hypothetical protein ACH5RR_011003 [Cinchona calisaya]|uniref:Uncharacterized protein n=1 Tax=Cinchona calisaya TaxID=153742 RepID=A0ABD3A3N6_9GENT